MRALQFTALCDVSNLHHAELPDPKPVPTADYAGTVVQ